MKNYIIKLSPEIIIKSKAVRKKTIQLLNHNISNYLKLREINFILTPKWDHIQLIIKDDLNSNLINNHLKKIFWIHNFYQVESFNFETLDDILAYFSNKYANKLNNKTFRVTARRKQNELFTSPELARAVGWAILKVNTWLKVSLEYPEITIEVEVDGNKCLIPTQRITWAWGFPIWAQGRVLSLISGWFDSGVSTYLTMKRGCRLDYLFFNLGWTAHSLWVKQVSHYIRSHYSQWHRAEFYEVNFDFLIRLLVLNAPEKLRSVLLKRYMLKAASFVARKKHYALVKWDSLWQVSSQTLENLHIIDKASELLILRPLITYDKQEIINIAETIWTAKFAKSMPEYCWAISNKQTACGKMEEVLVCEEKINAEFFEILKTSVVRTSITDVLNNTEIWEIPEIAIPEEDEIIIDIREESQKKQSIPFSNTILDIPFYDINSKFEHLDQTKNYLLFCTNWVMSKLHGLYLKEKWFNNIKVLVNWSDSCRI